MHVREGSPRVNEHRSRKDDARCHCEEKSRFNSFRGEVLPVEVLLVKVGKDTEERRDTREEI